MVAMKGGLSRPYPNRRAAIEQRTGLFDAIIGIRNDDCVTYTSSSSGPGDALSNIAGGMPSLGLTQSDIHRRIAIHEQQQRQMAQQYDRAHRQQATIVTGSLNQLLRPTYTPPPPTEAELIERELMAICTSLADYVPPAPRAPWYRRASASMVRGLGRALETFFEIMFWGPY